MNLGIQSATDLCLLCDLNEDGLYWFEPKISHKGIYLPSFSLHLKPRSEKTHYPSRSFRLNGRDLKGLKVTFAFFLLIMWGTVMSGEENAGLLLKCRAVKKRRSSGQVEKRFFHTRIPTSPPSHFQCCDWLAVLPVTDQALLFGQ